MTGNWCLWTIIVGTGVVRSFVLPRIRAVRFVYIGDTPEQNCVVGASEMSMVVLQLEKFVCMFVSEGGWEVFGLRYTEVVGNSACHKLFNTVT